MPSELYGSGTTPKIGDTERMLLVKMVQGGGGGGGGSAPLTSIAVPGPPGGAPPTYSNFVVDSNGRTWTYWGGAWH